MITIRNYRQEDVPFLWKIFFNTVRNINARDYSKIQIEAWAPESLDLSIWKSKINRIKPFVAEIDNVIVGYSDLQSTGLIDHFFCHYEYQGQGVGSALMNHILKVGKEVGITRFYSEVSITAKPFYEYFGFKVVKQQIMEVRGEKLINYVMEKQSDI